MTVDSIDATVYVTWERLVRRMLVESRVPGELVDEFVMRSNEMLVPALTEPSRIWFDGDVVNARDQLDAARAHGRGRRTGGWRRACG